MLLSFTNYFYRCTKGQAVLLQNFLDDFYKHFILKTYVLINTILE